MTQAVRGPITKISQSKCSIAGPIFSKYRTGHCPEWSHTCVFASLCFLQSCNKSLINQACSGPYWENIGPRSFSYGPSAPHTWLIRYMYQMWHYWPSNIWSLVDGYKRCMWNRLWSISLKRNVCSLCHCVCWTFGMNVLCLPNFTCLMTNHATFDTQLQHVSVSLVHT